jgi:hypothetical protein
MLNQGTTLATLNMRSQFFSGWTAIPVATSSYGTLVSPASSYTLTGIPLPKGVDNTIGTDMNVFGEVVGVLSLHTGYQHAFVYRIRKAVVWD